MNRAASNLASREVLQEAVLYGGLLDAETGWNKVISRRKDSIVLGKVSFPHGMGVIRQVVSASGGGGNTESHGKLPHWY